MPVSRRAYRNPFGQNEGVRCSHVVSELLHALGSACDFMSLRTLLKLLSRSLKFSPVHQTDKYMCLDRLTTLMLLTSLMSFCA